MYRGLKFHVTLFVVFAIISFIVMLITSEGEIWEAFIMSLIIGAAACGTVICADIEAADDKANVGRQKMMSCSKCGHISPASSCCPKCGSCFVRKFYI